MSTEQGGAVVIQVTARDFEQLWENSSAWGLGEGSGRFEDLDGGPSSSRQWRLIYWLGRNYTAVIFARAFLAARGFDYEILFDTASDDAGGRIYGYVILTDYEEQRLGPGRWQFPHDLAGDDVAELAPVRLKLLPHRLDLQVTGVLFGGHDREGGPRRVLGVDLVHQPRLLLVRAEQPGPFLRYQHQRAEALVDQRLVLHRLALLVGGQPAVRAEDEAGVVDQLDGLALGELQEAGDLGAGLLLGQFGVGGGDDLADTRPGYALHLGDLGQGEPVSAVQADAALALKAGVGFRPRHTLTLPGQPSGPATIPE